MSNGVRQCGILSPILFNIYVDDLSAKLINLKIGCKINDVYVNRLMYADDTVIIAPSYTAMQKLIDCCNFAVDNNIIIYLYVLSSFTCIFFKTKPYNFYLWNAISCTMYGFSF